MASRVSVLSMLEATMVVWGRDGIAAGLKLDLLLEKAAVELVPVTPDHANGALGDASARETTRPH